MGNGSIRSGIFAALLLAVAHSQGAAQISFDVQVSPMVTGTLFLSQPPSRFAIFRQSAAPLIVEDGDMASTFGAGVNAGVRIADNFGVEGMFWWLPGELTAGAGLESYGGAVDTNSMMYGATLAYYFPRIGVVEPFVGVGVGGETLMYDPELAWQRHTDFMSNAVVGAQLWIGNGLAFRLEGRDCLTRFHSNVEGVATSNEHDLMLSAGLTFRTPLGG
jgi:outer membrane protein W